MPAIIQRRYKNNIDIKENTRQQKEKPTEGRKMQSWRAVQTEVKENNLDNLLLHSPSGLVDQEDQQPLDLHTSPK